MQHISTLRYYKTIQIVLVKEMNLQKSNLIGSIVCLHKVTMLLVKNGYNFK